MVVLKADLDSTTRLGQILAPPGFMFFPLRDHNPSRPLPVLTYGLMLLNAAAFGVTEFCSSVGSDWLLPAYALIPRRWAADPVGEMGVLFIGLFLHAHFWRLATDLVFLNIFGSCLEAVLGKWRYLAFYMASALCTALLHIALDSGSAVPMVGATGAVAGVVGGTILLYARAPIVSLSVVPLLWFVLPVLAVVPAWWIAAEFLLVSALGQQGLGTELATSVAIVAQLGGVVAGMVLVLPLRARAQQKPRPWTGFHRSELSKPDGETRWKRTRQLGE